MESEQLLKLLKENQMLRFAQHDNVMDSRFRGNDIG